MSDGQCPQLLFDPRIPVRSRRGVCQNCFAWAVRDSERWWNPLEPENPYYWVEGVPAELTMTAFIQAYAAFGYVPCDRAELEAGFEKIALYATPDGEPTHAARQLRNHLPDAGDAQPFLISFVFDRRFSSWTQFSIICDKPKKRSLWVWVCDRFSV